MHSFTTSIADHSHQRFSCLHKELARISSEVAAVHAQDVDRGARFPTETVQALREAGIFSAAIPQQLGGAGAGLFELCRLCATLAQGCGSSAMVLAMHYSQLACITRHGLESEFFKCFLRRLATHQYLLASITSEVGTYGDTRTSVCCIERQGTDFKLLKEATTGSYCAHANAILVTARRDEGAAPNDQVLVLVQPSQYKLTQTTSWDTMGMRGTCSPGFRLDATAPTDQILPGSFADSSAQSMLPYSHILWASLWWGIAADAVGKAASFVRAQARQNPGALPPTATRLAEVSQQLQAMKQNWQSAALALDAIEPGPAGQEELSSIAWALRLNNLKVSCSEAAPQIVHKALQIVGILGYKNDSPFSMSRQYRDCLSGSLMISNDRILARSASMLLVFKDAT